MCSTNTYTCTPRGRCAFEGFKGSWINWPKHVNKKPQNDLIPHSKVYHAHSDTHAGTEHIYRRKKNVFMFVWEMSGDVHIFIK